MSKCNSENIFDNATRYPKMIGDFSRYNEYQFTEFYNFDRYLFSHIVPEIKQIDVDEENK